MLSFFFFNGRGYISRQVTSVHLLLPSLVDLQGLVMQASRIGDDRLQSGFAELDLGAGDVVVSGGALDAVCDSRDFFFAVRATVKLGAEAEVEIERFGSDLA